MLHIYFKKMPISHVLVIHIIVSHFECPISHVTISAVAVTKDHVGIIKL